MLSHPPAFLGIRPPHVLALFTFFSFAIGTSVLLILKLKFYVANEGDTHPAFQTLLSYFLVAGLGYLIHMPMFKMYEYESMPRTNIFGFWNVIVSFYNQLTRIFAGAVAMFISNPQYKKLLMKNLKNLWQDCQKYFPHGSTNVVHPAANIPMHDLIT